MQGSESLATSSDLQIGQQAVPAGATPAAKRSWLRRLGGIRGTPSLVRRGASAGVSTACCMGADARVSESCEHGAGETHELSPPGAAVGLHPVSLPLLLLVAKARSLPGASVADLSSW